MTRSRDDLSTIVESPQQLPKKFRSLKLMEKVQLHKMLHALLEERRLSVRDLAKGTGIPVSTIGSYLAGRKASYAPDHLAALADFFDITVDYLLFNRGPVPSTLNSLPLEEIFQGWLRVRVERAIPTKKQGKGDSE